MSKLGRRVALTLLARVGAACVALCAGMGCGSDSDPFTGALTLEPQPNFAAAFELPVS